MEEKYVITKSNASEQEIAEALALLSKKRERQDKIAKGLIKGGQKWSEKSDEQKAKMRDYNKKRQAKMALLAQKALEAGITVSEDEVEMALMEKE
jgi:lysyl-tRNA synthetase class I